MTQPGYEPRSSVRADGTPRTAGRFEPAARLFQALAEAPLRARRAKRSYFGGARIVHQLLVLGRFNRDQRDFAFAVVMKAPAVALRQSRHPKVWVALTQELLAFFGPDGLRDVM